MGVVAPRNSGQYFLHLLDIDTLEVRANIVADILSCDYISVKRKTYISNTSCQLVDEIVDKGNESKKGKEKAVEGELLLD